MPGRATSRSRHLVWPLECDSKNSSADENVSTANPNCFSKSGNDSRTDSSSSITDTSGVPANIVMRVCRYSQLQAEWHRGKDHPRLSFSLIRDQTAESDRNVSIVHWYRSAAMTPMRLPTASRASLAFSFWTK